MVMNALLGAAGKMSDKDQKAFEDRVCVDNETIEAAFKVRRDAYVFTNRRVIFEDVQGITGRKRSMMSIPYSRISAFEVESAGIFDTDGELRIWISGYPEAVKFEFRKSVDVALIQALLARHM